MRGPEGQIHLPIDTCSCPRSSRSWKTPPFKRSVTTSSTICWSCETLGVDVQGVALDSMVAAFLLDASRMQYGIDRLALDLLNFRKVATVELLGKGKAADHDGQDRSARRSPPTPRKMPTSPCGWPICWMINSTKCRAFASWPMIWKRR